MQRFHLDSMHIGCDEFAMHVYHSLFSRSFVWPFMLLLAALLCFTLCMWVFIAHTHTYFMSTTIRFINPFIFIEYAFMFILNGWESRHHNHNHNYHAVDTNWNTQIHPCIRTNVWKVELHFIYKSMLLTWNRSEWRYEEWERERENAQRVCVCVSLCASVYFGSFRINGIVNVAVA